jgi:soluble lytic murein transglycosylase-like protein
MRSLLVCVLILLLAAPAQAVPVFWKRVPPDIAAGRPGRLPAAAAFATALGAGEGALRRVSGVAVAHGPEIAAAARAYRVSEALLLALVAVESGGNARAVSPKGAQGLGQLMPATAERFGVRDAFDPTQNLRGAAAYLSLLLNRYRGDALLALAAYNAGEGAVDRARGVPPYAETRAYVPRVLAHWQAARRLCVRRPSLPRHPCPARWGLPRS